MKLKNVMSLFICYVMFLSLLLSGCAKEQLAELPQIDRAEQLVETDSYFTLNKDRTEHNVKGWKYEPLVTVTTFRILNSKIKFPKGQDYENNVWFDAYREYLGIDLKYTFVCPSEDSWRKSSQGFAVDNLPDIMPVYATLFYKLSDAERLCDLKPYYQRYASEDVKYWMEKVDGGVAYDCSYRYEKLHALAAPVKRDVNNVMWIRNDWLDNVGLEWPNNFNETLNVMRAFRNNDPDQNGKKDTYGMALNAGLDGLSAISVPLGAKNGWIDTNEGEDIEYGYIQPEWKEVCRVASELYKEGVIDPNFIEKSTGKMDKDYENQVFGLTASKTAVEQIDKSVEVNSECDWACGYIKDSNGNIAIGTANTAIQQFVCVNKRSLYPEAAILLTNIWEPLAMGENPEYHEFVGKDGVRYNSSDYTPYGFGGPVDYDYQCYEKISSALTAENEGNTSKRDEIISTMNGEQKGYYDSSNAWRINKDVTGWKNYNLYGPQGLKGLTANIEKQELYHADRIWGMPCDAWIKYGPNLHNKHVEYFLKIIIGKWDVDEGFDKWLRYFYKAGGQECIDGYNEWWDTEGKAGFERFGGV